MANSKFEYVRNFETADNLLLDTWIVIRIDGRGFHKLSSRYGWKKPNDRRAVDLANEAARNVMKEVQDLVMAYGQSDEYSFVFPPSTTLFDRRSSKLTSTIVSTFTAYYIHLWPTFFPASIFAPPLTSPLPTFDGRAVLYPTSTHLRDYLSWRQADCHINNLYNTTFWALMQQGDMSAQEAEKALSGTYSSDKHELLFKQFGVNYNNEEEIWKKGSVIFRDMSDRKAEMVEDEKGNEYEPKKDEEKPVQASVIANTPSPAKKELSREQRPTTTTSDDAASSTSNQPLHPPIKQLSKTQQEKLRKRRAKAVVTIEHVDIIKDAFWQERPWILSG